MTLSRQVKRLLSRGEGAVRYECAQCRVGFELNRQLCPDCGSYRIERTTYDDLLSTE